MPQPPTSRSVKIDQDERGGWSSDRPRRDGAPPRPVDVAVRGRAIKVADVLRYNPGSLLVVVSGSTEARDELIGRVVEERGAVLTLDKVRALLAGKGIDDDERATQLLDAAVAKRLENGDAVVLGTDGVTPEERERYVRMANKNRRPCHLILVEAPRDQVAEDDHAALNDLRKALDSGTLGSEGFNTFLRLGGAAIAEVKRVIFRPPPSDD
jgi:AAA domain-containing protein